jgi:hypothetical protein
MPVDFELSPIIPEPAPQPVPQPSVPAPLVPGPLQPPEKKMNRMLQWLVVAAAGLVIITVGALWFGGSSFSDKDVVVTLTTSPQATSGDEITYTITYANNTKLSLSSMNFRLFYPQGTIVLNNGQPTTPESDTFTVDKLDPGQSGTHEFKVFIVGDRGAIQTARLDVVFNAGTLQSSFQKEMTTATTITALPVTLTLVAPPTATSGQPVEYILDVRNDSGQDLSDLKILLTYPDGFVVQKMNPNPTTGNTTWALAALASSVGKRITVDGVLQGNQQEAKTVTAVLQRNLNGQYVDYVRTDATTMISSPLLSVSVAPNKGRGYVAFPGDTLQYTVAYGNNSQFTLLGMTLAVKLEGDMYDTSRIQSQQGTFDDNSNTLTFDSSGVSDFAALPPGRTGTLTFSVPLKVALSGASMGGTNNFFVKATARLSTSNVPTGVDGSEVFATDSVITKIGTQPSLGESILYDGGAGSGPMPPKVGSETTYTVRWQLTNPGNDVRNATVVATIPPGVTFKDAATASNGTAPVYDKVHSTVTWSVGTLPFGTGTGASQYQAQFQISIKPSASQQGQSPKIITGTAMTGTDSFTSQAVQSSARDMTTSDIDGHSGQGAVVAQ